MKTTTLGVNGPLVSQFGVGAMSFAGVYGDATVDESHAILDAAREAGVTHIDTSNVYGMGRSEEIIGAWLAARTGARGETTIATKAGITRKDGQRAFDNSRAHLESELDASLKRLGVDHVDLFYVHRLEAERPVEETAEGLAAILKTGKTRAVGLSEVAPSTLRRAASVMPIAAVQSEYSLSTRAPELGLVQACRDLGTTLVAFSPVGRSFLTDAPFSFETAKGLAFTASNPRFLPPNYALNIAATDRFRALAREMGEPAAALAIAWLIAQGDHVLPIPGTKSPAHFAELVRGAEIDLSPGDLAAIDKVLPVGWAHGDRYSADQWVGPERYS
jgi:aryl-alcohol dehydrogenase-like predicted oxidoreductase